MITSVLSAIAAIPKIAAALTDLVGAVNRLGKSVHATQRKKTKDAKVEAAIADVLARKPRGVRKRKAGK